MLRSVRSLRLRAFKPYFSLIYSREVATKVDFQNPQVVAQLDSIRTRFNEITELMSSSTDPDTLRRLGKEYSDLGRTVELIQERDGFLESIAELEGMGEDEEEEELVELAKEELVDQQAKLLETEESLIDLMTPRDAADDRGVVVEVRAGTGGDEASLFAGEVFKMYQKYAVKMGWRWEELDMSVTDIGGFKGAQASVTGEAVFERLKFESGVHRVQRVPVNDKRIHTSAASVVVLPEAEEVDVELRPSDLQIDVFRSSGAGGQSVNKTESAVRITHLPTGCSVSMQDERCQHQNREKAMKILRARVYDLMRREADTKRSELVDAAGGTGDRSDKIRTYNFPQDRITDHRVGLSLTGVERVLSGEQLDDIMRALVEDDRARRLQAFLMKLSEAK